MNKKIVILTADNRYIDLDSWQKECGLEVGSTQIGKHFDFTEFKFSEDLKNYGTLIVCAPLMKVLDKARELKGKAIHVNSFNRSDAKQAQLKRDGYRAATTSPHCVYMAADCDTLDEADTREFVKNVQEAAKLTGIPVRIGFQQYLDADQTFVHVDACPVYYAKGRPRHNEEHPLVWENQITW